MKTLKFKKDEGGFYKELQRRVNEYFGSKSKKGNIEMVIKTITMFTLFIGSYLAILFAGFAWWGMLLFLLPMFVGMIGIATCVMHDANHSAYSAKRWINIMLGSSMNLLGMSRYNWLNQHNSLHHIFTNIKDRDMDISVPAILRLSKYQQKLKIHRYQHIYAWFLYQLQTIVWFWIGDFTKFVIFKKMGLHSSKNESRKILLEIIITKMLHISYMIIIPIILLPIPWWGVIIGFCILHILVGEALTIIFQMAHVMENTEMYQPDSNLNAWAIHQLKTTTNFAPNAKIFGWFIGGLNHQVEHHLFSNVCHVHYRKLSKIVKATAEEFGITYNEYKTFWSALAAHYRYLKWLGKTTSV